MKRFPIAILLFALQACQEKNEFTNQGNKLTITSDTAIKLIQTASGTILPYKEVMIRDSRFQVVMLGNDTIFVSTKDSNFTTPEDYRIGIRFGDLPKQLKNNIKKEPGFSYWINLSGWKLGFCNGNSCTDYIPLDSSAVDFIFKRY